MTVPRACTISLGPTPDRKQYSVGEVVNRGWPFEWECERCHANRPQQLMSTAPNVWQVLPCKLCKPKAAKP